MHHGVASVVFLPALMVIEEERGSYSIIGVGVIVGYYRKRMAQMRNARQKSKKDSLVLKIIDMLPGGGQFDVLL